MMMMKTLVAALLATTVGLAHAQLSWSSRGAERLTATFDPSPSVGLTYAARSMNVGDLSIALTPQQSATVSFTYLGHEALWLDSLSTGSLGSLNNASALGTQTTLTLAPGYTGALPFAMSDPYGKVANNGGTWSSGVSIGRVATNFTASKGSVAGQKFQYVLGFNDSSASSNDWDDLLVGVNVKINAVSAVPEPSSWALLAGGLGVIGVVGSRRRAPR